MDTNTSFSTTPFKKTAIVLDRRPSFSAHSKVSVDLDGGTKSKNSSKSSAQSFPVYKSIWSCMTEASIEYSRVVYDLYPCQNLVRFNNIFYNSLTDNFCSCLQSTTEVPETSWTIKSLRVFHLTNFKFPKVCS